jgi:drug/metabolite transporter (DMT)-like permease
MTTGRATMPGQLMNAAAWAMLIALSIVWGGSFFFAEIALRALGPLTIVAVRVSIGAAGLLVLAIVLGYSLPRGFVTWRDLFVMGVLNNVIPFSLIVWGQVWIDSGTASILNATTPFFTLGLAHFLVSDERMNAGRVLGIALGIVGVAMLAGPAAMQGLTLDIHGQIAVLGAAFSYALAGIWGKRRLAGLPPVPAAAGMLFASCCVMIPLALVREGIPELPQRFEIWYALAGIGLLSTSVAYVLYFRILAVAGASNLMLVTMLIPVSALLLGVLILGEAPQPGAYAGLALIAVGLAVIDGRLIQFFRRAGGMA